MNSKQRKILQQICEKPIRADILWADIEVLLTGLGCSVLEGSGSRIRVVHPNAMAVFHRPHPQKVTKKGAVKAVFLYLKTIGAV